MKTDSDAVYQVVLYVKGSEKSCNVMPEEIALLVVMCIEVQYCSAVVKSASHNVRKRAQRRYLTWAAMRLK